MTLPIPLTRFVGREAELVEAAALLGATRLLTLTGPGGAGKTRLALQLASGVADEFSDGVTFVDLAPLSGAEFVWDQVAAALGVSDAAPRVAVSEAVSARVAGLSALVVLDNCEHVVTAASEVAARLLAAGRGLKLIATSREPLGVSGEMTWVVPPLTEADGIELFTERAGQSRPGYALRERDSEAVRSICRRLDGLPLAIELAAARSRAYSPAEIASGLRGRLDMLPAGPRTAPARQATLQASFDWSYDLLSEPERALLGQCSVFAGGFDLDAALAVCPAASLGLLASLVDRSLLNVQDDVGGTRYRMLEPVRQFAARRLTEAGEEELTRAGHRDHYLRMAESFVPLLVTPEEYRWRARLHPERDNLRGALAYTRDHGDAEMCARMLAALLPFWAVPGRLAEFGTWVDTVYDRVRDLSAGRAAQVLNFKSILSLVSMRSINRVPGYAAEALRLAREAGDKGEEAVALSIEGLIAGFTAGGAEAMRPFVEKAWPLARESNSTMAGYTPTLLMSITAFVLLRLFQSNPDETRRLAEEVMAVAEARADRHNRLFTSSIAGLEAMVHGRLADAERILARTVEIGRPTNDSNYLGSLIGLAWVALFRGDLDAAQKHIAKALPIAQLRGNDAVSITSLAPQARFIRGWVELAEGDPAKATETLAPVVDGARSSFVAHFASVPMVVLAQAQAALGEVAEAEAFLDEAGSLAQAGEFTWVAGRIARVRAEIRTRSGELHEAETLAHQALALGREAGDQMGIVDALELIAAFSTDQQAARLWAAADSIRTRLGYRLVIDREAREVAIAKARESASAWAEGAKMSAEDAVAYATRGRGERKRPSTGWASLTPSEREVVRLVGEHLTNPEIAARLFVSRATVKTHLVHIFAKLGIDSRSELAAEATRRE